MKERLQSIVLIDDDPANNYLMEIFLREEIQFRGNCVSLNSMKEGLAHLQQLAADHQSFPSLILLDVNMPGKGGFDLLDAVKREGLIQQQHTKVIMFSAMVYDALLEQGKRYAEVLGVVEKDFSNQQLRKVIETYFSIN
ncbi:MAG: response regulator [Bacteroidota bacterium]